MSNDFRFFFFKKKLLNRATMSSKEIHTLWGPFSRKKCEKLKKWKLKKMKISSFWFFYPLGRWGTPASWMPFESPSSDLIFDAFKLHHYPTYIRKKFKNCKKLPFFQNPIAPPPDIKKNHHPYRWKGHVPHYQKPLRVTKKNFPDRWRIDRSYDFFSSRRIHSSSYRETFSFRCSVWAPQHQIDLHTSRIK